jgi:hypothetical protein
VRTASRLAGERPRERRARSVEILLEHDIGWQDVDDDLDPSRLANGPATACRRRYNRRVAHTPLGLDTSSDIERRQVEAW